MHVCRAIDQQRPHRRRRVARSPRRRRGRILAHCCCCQDGGQLRHRPRWHRHHARRLFAAPWQRGAHERGGANRAAAGRALAAHRCQEQAKLGRAVRPASTAWFQRHTWLGEMARSLALVTPVLIALATAATSSLRADALLGSLQPSPCPSQATPAHYKPATSWLDCLGSISEAGSEPACRPRSSTVQKHLQGHVIPSVQGSSMMVQRAGVHLVHRVQMCTRKQTKATCLNCHSTAAPQLRRWLATSGHSVHSVLQVPVHHALQMHQLEAAGYQHSTCCHSAHLCSSTPVPRRDADIQL